MKGSIIIAAALMIAAAAPRVAAAKGDTQDVPKTATLGQPVPDFTLTDSLGKKHKLSEHKDKVVVLEWLNYGCPFVKKQYNSKNMQSLQKEYGDKGVVWYSIISSRKGAQGNYPADKINAMNKERDGHAAAILLDYQGEAGRLFDAKTTPDMFVIDHGVLKYEGAIDDKPTTDLEDVPGAHNYVREALDLVLAGKPVKTTYTKSYGCGVKY